MTNTSNKELKKYGFRYPFMGKRLLQYIMAENEEEAIRLVREMAEAMKDAEPLGEVVQTIKLPFTNEGYIIRFARWLSKKLNL